MLTKQPKLRLKPVSSQSANSNWATASLSANVKATRFSTKSVSNVTRRTALFLMRLNLKTKAIGLLVSPKVLTPCSNTLWTVSTQCLPKAVRLIWPIKNWNAWLLIWPTKPAVLSLILMLRLLPMPLLPAKLLQLLLLRVRLLPMLLKQMLPKLKTKAQLPAVQTVKKFTKPVAKHVTVVRFPVFLM